MLPTIDPQRGGVLGALAPINGTPIWRATQRHRSITFAGVVVAIGWMGSVHGLLRQTASHGEILGVFIAGLVPIVAVTALSLVLIGGRPRDEGTTPPGMPSAPSQPISSGLFDRHPNLRPPEPTRLELAVQRLPGPSARSRTRARKRRSATKSSRVLLVAGPLAGVAELLQIWDVQPGSAVAIAVAVVAVLGTAFYLRPKRIRGAAQAYVRWRIRRGTWNG